VLDGLHHIPLSSPSSIGVRVERGTGRPALAGWDLRPGGGGLGSGRMGEPIEGEDEMKRMFQYGGYFASGVLILFGLGSIVVGSLGFQEVRDTITRENITATPDAAEIGVDLEPGEAIDTGAEAKEFAKIIRTHTLEATGGRTYAEMGRYLTATGEETNDEAEAATDEQGNPVPNGLRNIWVTSTSLTTALNTSFLAERVALFSIVMGVAMLLTGIGFLVLTISALRPGSAPVSA